MTDKLEKGTESHKMKIRTEGINIKWFKKGRTMESTKLESGNTGREQCHKRPGDYSES